MSEPVTDLKTVVLDMGSMDLMFNKCDCGEINIHGFRQHIKDWLRLGENVVGFKWACRKCGKEGVHKVKTKEPCSYLIGGLGI